MNRPHFKPKPFEENLGAVQKNPTLMERKSRRQTDQPKPAQKPRQKPAQQPKPAQAQTQKPKPAQEASKPKRKQASKPTTATKSAQKRKSGQTDQPLSAYEAREKAKVARRQADLARIIQELNDIGNAASKSVPSPEDKDTGKGSDLSAPQIAKGCLTVIILGVLFTYALGLYVHKQDERKRAAMEIPADKDANHQGTDIAYPWGNQTGSPEAPSRPTNAPSAAAPADTITVSYQDYLLYRAMKNRYSGVELELGNGISIQTGLDESEIMDQIAADGDIYSLTDYFDEYVGD